MKKAVLYFVLLLVSFRPGVIAQDFLDTLSYIPVVVTSWQDIDGDYRDGIPLIKAMGADAMVIANHSWNDLSIFNPMKILHYRHKQDAEPYDIVKYTDASYVVYEAEGTKLQDGRASLTVNNDVGFIPGGATYAQTSGTTPGYLIEGPGVLMRKNYQDYYKNLNPGTPDDWTIPYTTEFVLKLDHPSGGVVQVDPEEIICVVKITLLDSLDRRVTIDSVTVEYIRFLNGGINQWITIPKNYKLKYSGLKAEKNQFPSVWVDQNDSALSATFVEYCVYWYGVQGCTLYVDKIITSDERGREIKFDSTARTNVFTAATNYIDSDHMLGWYGMEEPKFIDNYEPYRVVDSLIRAATNNTQFLHTSITVGEKGKYWYGTAGSQGLSPLIEFAKRAKPHSIHLNSYHYDYPLDSSKANYLTENINYAIRNLDSMAILYRGYELDFSHAVYGGHAWSYSDSGKQSHVLKRPSEKKLLYTMNLGLLYGAKQIWIDPAFSYDVDGIEGKPGTRGLLEKDLSTTSTYNTFKDTIIPRLHGEFGRTLRKLKAVSQFTGVMSDRELGADFRFIRNNLYTTDSTVFEFGVFHDPQFENAKYLFALYRFVEPALPNLTSLPPDLINIVTMNLSPTYSNYRVHELVTGTMEFHSRLNDNSIIFNVSTNQGDGRLYEIVPVQLASGNKSYLYDETFTVNETIYANDTLIVGPGVTLTFNNGSSLINHGTMIMLGTSQQPVTLNFIQPGNNNGLFNYNRLIVSDFNISNAAKGVSNEGTFIVNPGATLTFNGSSSLHNYATLSIQGSAQQPVSLNFVQPTGSNGLHNYGTLEMNHTTVANASIGISNSDASLNVNSSVIHNNTTGISLTMTNLMEIPINPSIQNTEFYFNGTGIMTSQAVGTIKDNKFYYNDYGLVLTNNTVLTFGDFTIQGNNCIYDNGIGVLVNGSMPVIGSDGQAWVGGNNSISGNGDWDCLIINYSSVLAENNFWGTGYIMVDRSSSASFQPEIYRDPCGQLGSSLMVRGGKGKQKLKQNVLEGGEDDIIKQAYSLIQGPRFREGIQLCKQVIDNSPDTSIAAPALMLLSLAEQKHQLNELKPYLQLLSASTTENRVRFVADMLLANDSNGNTRSRIELLLEKYVDTDIREEIHFSIFREYLFTDRDTTGARGILRMMKERYTGQLTELAEFMMDGKKLPGGISKPMNTEDGAVIPVEYLLKGNYPNPFNPETVIEYGIPEAAEVTLEVYDIMGRLMNRENRTLQAGYHFYKWNGKEASSGVYLYRIMMKSLKDRKVRTFSSKMMLLR